MASSVCNKRLIHYLSSVQVGETMVLGGAKALENTMAMVYDCPCLQVEALATRDMHMTFTKSAHDLCMTYT